ncbi:hypothetical protein [Streptomyces purpureus]|uniref:YcaO domain-containing protein n=1 Tax=Streptomyces purpureus TaxID=1951 RepID=A0A918HJ79_9ACTN|nr:hypothetical protein [Streptomyces purpureus]GGT66673.1 hypothetical protein GCM10014713_69100 [Streptomyces purpureus]
MLEASVADCALRDVVHRSYRSDRTVTVRCTVHPASGSPPADGYGTATTEAVARKKALSEAVERLLACTPFASVARPPTTHLTTTGDDRNPWPAGVRTAPEGCLTRTYRPLTRGALPRQVPLFWSSPWIAGEELRSALLTAQTARLSSTIGWAVAPSPEAALRGALFELTELINYGVFLFRALAGPPHDGRDSGPGPLILPIDGATRTPTVLAVARGGGRRMPATGLGSGTTRADATDRALLELAQAVTLWRSNPTGIPAERHFMRRFDRWPLLTRCATLDFDLTGYDAPPDGGPRPSPLEELEARGIAVWADSGALDLSGPDLARTRLHFAQVVADPQPLLGLVRAGIPVFDTGEVRKILDSSRRERPADRRPSGRNAQGGCPARA